MRPLQAIGSAQMRLLFCQTFPYLPSEGGGALSNTDELCQLLPGRGFEVAVLAGLRRSAWSQLRSRAGRDGMADRALGYPVHRARDPLVLAAKLAQTQRPDLAVVQVGDVAALCGIFLAARIPTLVYFHDSYSMPPAEALPPHPLLSFAACSAALAERVNRRLGVQSSVIPVLVQPERYRTEPMRRAVTFVNPIPRKGLDIAFALAARRPDIPFEFVESLQLRGRVVKLLQARIAHHGNIRLVRRVMDMRPVYRQSRIVLFPSLCEESWGRVVSEAQVSGIPALASNSGGLPEAMGAGGLMLDREAPMAAWAQALARLWDDDIEYARYAEQAAAHAARPEFQPAAVLSRLTELVVQLRASAGG
jgi:glycosyltransferase involved in cell wall biosynthesis